MQTSEVTVTSNTKRRIPRPKGFTNLARVSTSEVVYDLAIKEYLSGNWADSRHLSAPQFAELYNIPYQMVAKRIKDGLASELLQSNDIRATLEEERLKVLSSSLFRIGDSDFQIQRLLRYLSSRILSSNRPWPELIKELNTTIGTQVRLTESSLKVITLLNQTLDSVPEPLQEASSAPLSREEILEELNKIQASPESFQKYLEGTPRISPHSAENPLPALVRVPESSEYQRAKEVPTLAAHTRMVIPPL